MARTDREKSLSPVELMLTAKLVRVGSFRGAAIEPILVSKNGLSFFIEGKEFRILTIKLSFQDCLPLLPPLYNF